MPGAFIPYPNSTIRIREPSAAVPYTKGDYVLVVSQHLNDIREYPLGDQFIFDLMAANKQQDIIYAPSRGNSCECSDPGLVVLRQMYENRNNAGSGAELTLALGLSGNNAQWLAHQVAVRRLPNYQNQRERPTWWESFPNVGARTAAVQALVPQWLAGAALPNIEQLDTILYELRSHLTRGVVWAAGITYDPDRPAMSGPWWPPQCALFHELVHAYYTAMGEQLSIVYAGNVMLARYFEIMSVGLQPFHTARYSENALRRLWPGCVERPNYA